MAHSSAILSQLNNFRLQNMYCDISFVFGQNRFHAHKLVLAAGTKRFRDMFGTEFNGNAKQEMILENVNEIGFKAFLDYLYSGEIQLDKESIKHVVTVAEFYNVDSLLDICADYVLKNINVDNATEYHTLAIEAGCNRLMSRTKEFVLENFAMITKSKQFLQVSFDILKEFIDSDSAFVFKEDFIYDAILKWVTHDYVNRKQYVGELIKDVRFQFINAKYMMDGIFSSKLILSDIDCTSFKIIMDNVSSATKSRRMEGIYLFGQTAAATTTTSEDVSSEMSAVRFISSNNAVKEVKRMNKPTKITSLRTVASDNCIYMYTLNSATGEKTFSRLDDSLAEWINLEVSGFGTNVMLNMIHLDIYDTIYANGKDDYDIYCYRTDLDDWTVIGKNGFAELNDKSSLINVRNSVLSCGGIYRQNDNPRDDVYLFDPRVGKWSKKSSMLLRFNDSAGTVLNDRVYVTGQGNSTNGGNQFWQFGTRNIVQMYDIRADSWQIVKPMNTGRTVNCLLPYKNKLYAIGGSPQIEVYDPIIDTWTTAFTVDFFRDNNNIVGCVL